VLLVVNNLKKTKLKFTSFTHVALEKAEHLPNISGFYIYTELLLYIKQILVPFCNVTHLLRDPKFPKALHYCIKAVS